MSKEATNCKFCGSSSDVIKYGQFQGIQRYFCKKCARKFVDKDTLPRMKTSIKYIATALNMYYEGVSLSSISKEIKQQYGNSSSIVSIYNWVFRFTKEGLDYVLEYQPNVGDVWIADETVVKIEGRKIWFWEIIDTETMFLLASHMSLARTTQDARILIETAFKRSAKTPKVIITDKLQAYLDGIEQVFGAATKHVPARSLSIQPDASLIKRFRSSYKEQHKIIRRFKSIKTASLLLDGWYVHYNFFRPHESLEGETPANKAGIMIPLRSWLDVVKQTRVRTYKALSGRKKLD